MKWKKGMGILEVLSVWMYFIIVVFFMILLSLPSCIRPGAKESTITSDDDIAKLVKAQLEVSAALRTPLPDDLPDRLSWLDSKNFGLIEPDREDAQEDLRADDGLYKGRTYAEFIAVLESEAISPSRKQNLFVAVTYFMFSKHVSSDFYEITVPVSVIYRETKTFYKDAGISAVIYQYLPFFEVYIPLPDGDIATVRVHYEQVSMI